MIIAGRMLHGFLLLSHMLPPGSTATANQLMVQHIVHGLLPYGTFHPSPTAVQRIPGLKDQGRRMLAADTWSDANAWNSPAMTCGCIQMHPHAWHAASSKTPDMPSRCCCTVQTPAWWQDQACPGVHKVQARHWHSPHLGPSSEGTLLLSRSTSNTLLMSQQSSRCMWSPKPNPLSPRRVPWQAPWNHPAAQAAASGRRWCVGMPLLLPQLKHPGPPG